MQGRIVELEAELTELSADYHGERLRADSLYDQLRKEYEASDRAWDVLQQKYEKLRGMLQTAWNMSDAEFEEALPEEGK